MKRAQRSRVSERYQAKEYRKHSFELVCKLNKHIAGNFNNSYVNIVEQISTTGIVGRDAGLNSYHLFGEGKIERERRVSGNRRSIDLALHCIHTNGGRGETARETERIKCIEDEKCVIFKSENLNTINAEFFLFFTKYTSKTITSKTFYSFEKKV